MNSTKLSRYIALAGAVTSYARRITHLRNRIFGEVVRPTAPQSLRVVNLYSALPRQQNPHFVKYYPRHVETHLLMRSLRDYGLYRDEHQDFKEEMKRLRALRGKARPKKGEGKRSKK